MNLFGWFFVQFIELEQLDHGVDRKRYKQEVDQRIHERAPAEVGVPALKMKRECPITQGFVPGEQKLEHRVDKAADELFDHGLDLGT